MKLKILDGTVVFAVYSLNINRPLNRPGNLKLDLSKIENRFDMDGESILCYSEQERAVAEDFLTEQGFSYTVEVPCFTREQKDKVAGKKYNSRSEAIQHLNDEIDMPESEIIPFLKQERNNLKAENNSLKIRLSQAENALLTVMFKKEV